MEHEFWNSRWREGRTAFHEEAPNPNLLRHLPVFKLGEGAQLFLPLCGKTVDIDWLLSKGFQVTGCELNQAAVEAVFDRLGVEPEIEEIGSLKAYRSGGLSLFQGDFFKLEQENIGSVDLVYDRAALVALPWDMRADYAKQLRGLTSNAQQLLISYDYNQAELNGPPFSVSEAEIIAHYGQSHAAKKLASHDIWGPLADRVSGLEQVWQLTDS